MLQFGHQLIVKTFTGSVYMINESQARKYCREDITLIKNYAKAIADKTETWICHHRNAEPFTGFCTADLKKMNMYENRPASELMFVTRSEHQTIHTKGKRHSAEARKKISDAKKGKTLSDEHKHKLSESHKGMTGKRHSEETKKKMSESQKGKSLGKHWYNNGIINTFAKSCPDGFVEGVIRKEKN